MIVSILPLCKDTFHLVMLFEKPRIWCRGEKRNTWSLALAGSAFDKSGSEKCKWYICSLQYLTTSLFDVTVTRLFIVTLCVAVMFVGKS